MVSEIPPGEPSVVDGIWLDTKLGKKFYLREARLWAAEAYSSGGFTVQAGQIQGLNLRRVGPRRFEAWHPGWSGPYYFTLTENGTLTEELHAPGLPVYRAELTAIELDDPAGLERERKLAAPPAQWWTTAATSAPSVRPAAATAPPAVDPRPQTIVHLPDRNSLGDYHALLIGNNAYKHLNKLRSAHADVRAIDGVLRGRYGFTTRILLDATRSQILQALEKYRSTLNADDNLLIYYAGHGWLDEAADEGYWLPIDARRDSTVNWISNATLTSSLKALRARHVLVVADSCYSGKLTRGMRIEGPQGDDYLTRMAEKRARIVLSSGGLEPVLDGGGGDHSVFAASFLGALRGNQSVLDTSSLFSEVRRSVMLSADQSPELADIRRADHEGGDFFFVPTAR